MSVKYIIFDLDGTLLDTLQDLTDSVNRALSAYGYPQRNIDEIRHFVGNGVEKLVIRAMTDYDGKLSGEDLRVFDGLFDYFKKDYAENCNNKTRPYPGVTDMLKELKRRGKKTAIVSNKVNSAVVRLAEMYFDGLTDMAVGETESEAEKGDPLIRKKPAPDSVYMALSAMGADIIKPDIIKPDGDISGTLITDGAVYVGDSEVDIETARNAGIRMIAVAWGFRQKEYLKKMGAEIIADNPEELLEMLTWRI